MSIPLQPGVTCFALVNGGFLKDLYIQHYAIFKHCLLPWPMGIPRMITIYQVGSDIAMKEAMSTLCQIIWFRLPVVVFVCLFVYPSPLAPHCCHKLVQQCSLQTCFQCQSQAGRAVELGSPSPAQHPLLT